MNDFLVRVHKQIMGSISELAPNTGTLTIDIAVDDTIGGMLYRFKPKFQVEKTYIVILTIASDVQTSDSIAGIVYPLIDNIQAKNDRLIIIHSNGKSKQENDIQTFLSEQADMFHPNYLRLPVSTNKALLTSVNGEKYTGLKNILKKYYSDEIVFIGPVVGKQIVNIETYKDACSICKKEIFIVSGIVFPKTQLPQWDNFYWKYYNTLIPIYSLPTEYSKQLKKEVNELRKNDSRITPLIFYQDVNAQENDWTVMCPYCNAVINKYEPEDNRSAYIPEPENRINGNLQYHPILIEASQKLINLLNESFEANCSCVCYGGWVESKNMQL